jgi:3-oxoadipate enol-lactonase
MPIRTINNVALHYEERGDRAKPSLVLAGGLLFGAECFGDLIPSLEKSFHVVRIDLHGHGRSGLRTPLILEEMADDCHELLSQLGLSKPVWIGHSIGGMLGMRMAYRYPNAFAALVLIATSARLDAPLLREQTWQLWQAFRAGQRATIADPALPFFFAQATFRERPELIRRYHDRIANFPDAENVFQCARAVFDRTDITEFLPSIVAPTLAIAGREDPAAPPAELQIIAECIPNARLLIIEQASHLVVAEKPGEVAEAVRSFLQGVDLRDNVDTPYSASMTDITPQAIPEIIRYKIPQDDAAAFESAYHQAEAVLQASSNCQGYELIRSDKDPQNYLLTIFWDSSEGHLEGFRKSDLFPKFLELIRPYIPMIQEMEHYHATGISWRREA